MTKPTTDPSTGDERCVHGWFEPWRFCWLCHPEINPFNPAPAHLDGCDRPADGWVIGADGLARPCPGCVPPERLKAIKERFARRTR